MGGLLLDIKLGQQKEARGSATRRDSRLHSRDWLRAEEEERERERRTNFPGVGESNGSEDRTHVTVGSTTRHEKENISVHVPHFSLPTSSIHTSTKR